MTDEDNDRTEDEETDAGLIGGGGPAATIQGDDDDDSLDEHGQNLREADPGER